MPSSDHVKAELARDVEAQDFLERLGARVGLSARASAVFGEPVEQSGVTVVPVAKAGWGFGGGSGGEGVHQGSGGGGGGVVLPIGFIEIRQGEAKFVPIRDPRMAALRVAVTAVIVGLSLRRRR